MRITELTMNEAIKQYRSFWYLRVLGPRKDGVISCYCCDSPNVIGRASMNIWGTIIDFPVCEIHAKLDGKWADSVPTKV